MKILCISILLLCIASLTHAATATLSWTDKSDNETGFRVERRTQTPAGPWSEVARADANAVTCQDTVSAGASVCYRVFAFNGTGDSLPSNEACITVVPTPPVDPIPNSPTDLKAEQPTTGP